MVIPRVFAVVAILATLPLLAGCQGAEAGGAGGGPRDAQPPTAEQTADGQEAGGRAPEERTTRRSSRDAEARAGSGAVARAGDAVARAGEGAENARAAAEASSKVSVDNGAEDTGRRVAAEEVVLRMGGERGTKFSGMCSVGDEERRIAGSVPKSYSYALGSEKLECDIRGRGPGTLKVVLDAGDGVRSVQQSAAGGSSVSFSYSGDGLSVVQSTSSGSIGRAEARAEANSSSGIPSDDADTR